MITQAVSKCSTSSARKKEVIRSYSDLVTKAYCTVRFTIMNSRILGEIGQYLPKSGRILDVGCGFGLFSLYYALDSPARNFTSLDINAKRIQMAKASANTLNISTQIDFRVQGVESLEEQSEVFEATYVCDLIHHLAEKDREPLLANVYNSLVPGGIFILKDIDTSPRWKVLFTWVLDMLMSPQFPPKYVDSSTMRSLLERLGFDVKIHYLLDILPYPHILYICRKTVRSQ